MYFWNLPAKVSRSDQIIHSIVQPCKQATFDAFVRSSFDLYNCDHFKLNHVPSFPYRQTEVSNFR